MKVINLLPKDEQKQTHLEFLFQHLLLFWFIVIGSLVVFIALIFATKIYLNRKAQATDAEIVKSHDTLNSSDYRSLQDQVLELNASIRELNNFIGQKYYWSKAIIALTNLIPADVQLNQVTLDRETGRIEILGQAESRDSVILLWSSIIKSDYFRDINFPLANLERAKIANFTFTFFVNKDKINKQ